MSRFGRAVLITVLMGLCVFAGCLYYAALQAQLRAELERDLAILERDIAVWRLANRVCN